MDYSGGPFRGLQPTEGACVSGSEGSEGVSDGPAARMGFAAGQVVLEIGADDDVDETLRSSIEQAAGSPMVSDDFDDVADVVVLWWHDDDGDLVDALVDGLSALASGGVLWLFTPKAGRDGHVEPSEIGEAARTAGLASTKSTSAAADWAGTRLVAPKIGR